MKIKVFCSSKHTTKKMDRWAIGKKYYSQLIYLSNNSYLEYK